MKTSASRRTPRFLLLTIIMLSLVVFWLLSADQLEKASAQVIGANTSFRCEPGTARD